MSEEKPSRFRFASLREFWGPYAGLAACLKPYRARWVCGLVFGAGFGLVNGSLPVAIQQVSAIIFYGRIDNARMARLLAPGGVIPHWLVVAACLWIPLVMVLRGLFSWLNAYCAEWVSQRVLMDLRSRLLRAALRQPMEYFNVTRGGDITSRVMLATMEAQGVLATAGTDLITQPISLVTGLVVLFALDWRFMVAALVLFPCCIFPARLLGRRIRHFAQQQQAGQGNMMAMLSEIIGGIKVVKSFSRGGFEAERFDAAGRAQFRQLMRMRAAMEGHGPVIEFIAALGVGLAFFYVHLSHLPGGKFIALCAGIFLLYQPIKTLTRLHLFLQRSLAATTAIFDLLKRVPSVKDAPDAIKLKHGRGEIVFENVGFSYREGIPAVSDISLRFEPGGHHALVGASGAGKSTMLSLILRFYDPGTGRVTFDGHDLRAVTQDSLREQIGIVTQDTFLFHDTIHANIAYGRLDATREEVVAAAKLAHAHEFILAQQDGYDTLVGDKGCMLSGGQQQRVSIARALLKNAPVLLLDEATSALDSESEKHIQAALETLIKGRTVIAIAHRLSTILGADRIIVMDAGRVVAAGTHAELLESSPLYRRLCELQFDVALAAEAP